MRKSGLLHRLARLEIRRYAMLQYLGFISGQWHRIGLTLVLAVLQAGAIFPMAFLVKFVFDHGVATGDPTQILKVGLWLLGLQIVVILSSLFNRLVTARVVKEVTANMRNSLGELILFGSANRHSPLQSGSVHAALVQDSERSDAMSSALIARVIPSLIVSILLLGVLAYLHVTLFFVILALIPVALTVNALFTATISRATNMIRSAAARFSSSAWFVVGKKDDIVSLTAEKEIARRLSGEIDDVAKAGKRFSSLQSLYYACYDMVTNNLQIAVVVLGGFFVAYNSMSIGTLLSFYFITGLLRSNLQVVSNNLPLVINGIESLNSIETIQRNSPPVFYAGRKVIEFNGNVCLTDVSFRYAEEPVFHGLTIELEKGSVTGLTGRNGSGKSTVVSLILGLYEPESGSIRAEDIPYTELDLFLLRSSMGLVPQVPFLLPGSVHDNLTVGNQRTVTDDDIRNVCEMVQLTDWIRGLHAGLSTPVGDEGRMISGGQIQRINLARALLRKPKLLILDEPANHLDEIGIENIFEQLMNQPDRPSILIISHDARLRKYCDRVVSLDNIERAGFSAAELVR